MRCISFASEQSKQRQRSNCASVETKSSRLKMKFSLLDFLGYLFYTPTLFGPIVNYPQFYYQVIESKPLLNLRFSSNAYTNTVVKLFKLSFQVLFWLAFVHFSNELFFIHLIAKSPELVKDLDNFGATVFSKFAKPVDPHTSTTHVIFVSLAWFYSQLFQAKYMVLYGVPTVMAFLDGAVSLPPLPIFASRVFLFSKAWKYFDAGLYNFLKEYIYIPCGGSKNPIRSSFLVFVFVYFWHGLKKSIFLWTVCNFLQICVEAFVRSQLIENETKCRGSIQAREDSWLLKLKSQCSPSSWRRILALAGAASYLWSIVGLQFFFFGYSVAVLMSSWTVFSFDMVFLGYLFNAYFWVQCIFSFENWIQGFHF